MKNVQSGEVRSQLFNITKAKLRLKGNIPHRREGIKKGAMMNWSISGCSVWVRWFFWWRQCPGRPVLAKDTALLCLKHKDLDVVDGRAVTKWCRFGLPYWS